MTWQQHLKQAYKVPGENPQKWQMVEQFAQALGAQFLQGHQVVQNRTDGELELRGRFHDFPARLKIDMSFFSPEWELKGSNPGDTTMYLHWDPKAVPDVGQFQGQAASDWDSDSHSTKVFFGRGYYLDAHSESIDRELAVYQSLPAEVRQALVTYMIGDKIARYYCYGRGDQLLGYKDEIHEQPDPLNQLARGVWLMGQVAWGLAQTNVATLPAESQPAAAGMLYKMTCGYCRSMYLWSQNQRCPNCGAPPQG